MYKQQAISEKGLDFNEINTIYNMPIESDINVLGKDSSENYLCLYISVCFILYDNHVWTAYSNISCFRKKQPCYGNISNKYINK